MKTGTVSYACHIALLVSATLLSAAVPQQPATPAPATSPVTPGPANPANTLVSVLEAKDWEPNADPQSAEWSGAVGVAATHDRFGEPLKLGATEIRSRWTRNHLYLLFICPYEALQLKPDPVTNKETDKLWNWEVAEAFIGSNYLKPERYKEFQVSPQSEYVDLDVDRERPERQKGIDWDSGMSVKGRIDSAAKVWYGEMKIPFRALEVKHPKSGDELRIGLFRITGPDPKRVYVSWRATGATTFHVPDSFGSLVLAKEPEKP